MEIGITTFHWATNYGAVLQAYALQQALKSLGHNVDIINYKPSQFDFSLIKFIYRKDFLHPVNFWKAIYKEIFINRFRKQYLDLTQRFSSLEELKKKSLKYDALVTGSDQVLNPYFLLHGEKNGSTAYFLDFCSKNCTKRISYASSFGVTEYPEELVNLVVPLIKQFDAISARENSGIEIFRKLGAINPQVVCDPTLLHDKSFYDKLISKDLLEPLTRTYFLRNEENDIIRVLNGVPAIPIESKGIDNWLNSIRSSSHIITNSFHGVVFCILYEIPFTVLLKSKENEGMNDRFFTLLEPLNLTKCIHTFSEFKNLNKYSSIDWQYTRNRLYEIRQNGWDFLKGALKQK